MKYRRELALLISAIGCAVALLFPAPRPGFVMSDAGVPLQFSIPAKPESLADADETMTALRRLANAALVNLQSGSVAPR